MFKIVPMGSIKRIAFALMLVMVLSACGQAATPGNAPSNKTDEAAKSTNQSNESTAEPAAVDEFWTYESDKGPVQIPRNPQRVVIPV